MELSVVDETASFANYEEREDDPKDCEHREYANSIQTYMM